MLGDHQKKLGVIHFGEPIIQLVRKECVPKAAGEHYWKINSQCHIECWGQAGLERSFGARGKGITLGRRKGNVYREVLSWSELGKIWEGGHDEMLVGNSSNKGFLFPCVDLESSTV